MGRNSDKVLADLTPEEAEHLHRITDGSSINPKTRLLEVYIDIFFQRVIYSKMTILDFHLVVQMSQMCTVSPLTIKSL